MSNVCDRGVRDITLEEDNKYVLVIIDNLEWNYATRQKHAKVLQDKLNDYLDYNRSVAHSVSKQRIKSKAIYDEHMDRYDGLWKYPVIPKRVKNV